MPVLIVIIIVSHDVRNTAHVTCEQYRNKDHPVGSRRLITALIGRRPYLITHRGSPIWQYSG